LATDANTKILNHGHEALKDGKKEVVLRSGSDGKFVQLLCITRQEGMLIHKG